MWKKYVWENILYNLLNIVSKLFVSPIFVLFENVLLLSKIDVDWSKLWIIYYIAEQLVDVLWAVHKN